MSFGVKMTISWDALPDLGVGKFSKEISTSKDLRMKVYSVPKETDPSGYFVTEYGGGVLEKVPGCSQFDATLLVDLEVSPISGIRLNEVHAKIREAWDKK